MHAGEAVKRLRSPLEGRDEVSRDIGYDQIFLSFSPAGDKHVTQAANGKEDQVSQNNLGQVFMGKQDQVAGGPQNKGRKVEGRKTRHKGNPVIKSNFSRVMAGLLLGSLIEPHVNKNPQNEKKWICNL
jgi:hypothetical protein